MSINSRAASARQRHLEQPHVAVALLCLFTRTLLILGYGPNLWYQRLWPYTNGPFR